METSRILKKVTLILCGLYIFVVARTPSAPEYEVSVMAGASPIVILLFILLIMIGVSMLVASVYTKHSYLLPAACSLSVAYSSYYLFPRIRDYALYSGFGSDQLIHLGAVQDTLNAGEMTRSRYPGTQSLLVDVKLVTGISLETIALVIPLWFFLIFIIYMVLFVRGITKDRSLAIFIGCASLPIIFGIFQMTIMPWLFGIYLLPLLLAVFHRHLHESGSRWGVLCVILLIAMVYYHPISTAFSVLMLFGLTLALITHEIRSGKKEARNTTSFINLFLITTIPLSMWYFLLGRAENRIVEAVQSLWFGTPGGSESASEVGSVDYTLSQTLTYFVLPELGLIIVYLAIASIATLVLVYRFATHRTTMFELCLLAFFGIGGSVGVLFFSIKIHGDNIIRANQLLIISSILLVGYAYHNVYQASRTSESKNILVAVMLILTISSTILIGAASGLEDDYHRTEATLQNHDWVLSQQASERPFVAYTGRDRIAFYLYGVQTVWDMQSVDKTVFSQHEPPRHLGYTKHQTVSAAFDDMDGIGNGGVYLTTRTSDLRYFQSEPDWRIPYRSVYYTENDIERLHADNTANKVYDNSESMTWIVQ